jgi:hypothetical protein
MLARATDQTLLASLPSATQKAMALDEATQSL